MIAAHEGGDRGGFCGTYGTILEVQKWLKSRDYAFSYRVRNAGVEGSNSFFSTTFFYTPLRSIKYPQSPKLSGSFRFLASVFLRVTS